MWKFIQGLNSNPMSIHQMKPYHTTVETISHKANTFVKHWDSKLNMSKADRDLNCYLRKQIEAPYADDENWVPFKWVSCCLPLKR